MRLEDCKECYQMPPFLTATLWPFALEKQYSDRLIAAFQPWEMGFSITTVIKLRDILWKCCFWALFSNQNGIPGFKQFGVCFFKTLGTCFECLNENWAFWKISSQSKCGTLWLESHTKITKFSRFLHKLLKTVHFQRLGFNIELKSEDNVVKGTQVTTCH